MRFPSRWWHHPILFLAVFGCVFGVGRLINQEPNVYREGMDIMVAEGPTESAAFFEAKAKASGDLKALFGYAWSAYVKGDYGVSERLGEYVLRESESDRPPQ